MIVSVTHPLANRDQLQLKDLCDYPLVMFHRAMAPDLYDDILNRCNAGGYQPARIEHGIRTAEGLLFANDAVTFQPSTSLLAHSPRCTWKPLVDEPLQWCAAFVCRQHENSLPIIQTVYKYIMYSLQRNDLWKPMPSEHYPA